LKFNDSVDKDVLRDYLNKNPKDRKKLEKLVHPLVKKEILRIFKTVQARIIVIEVPLLYESKMDNLFDVIIAIDVPSKKQKELLYNRNPITAEALLKINAEHKFDENKNKADFIIVNDAGLDKLKEKTNKIISKLIARLG
jgi:dephospho-CoA kinase